MEFLTKKGTIVISEFRMKINLIWLIDVYWWAHFNSITVWCYPGRFTTWISITCYLNSKVDWFEFDEIKALLLAHEHCVGNQEITEEVDNALTSIIVIYWPTTIQQHSIIVPQSSAQNIYQPQVQYTLATQPPNSVASDVSGGHGFSGYKGGRGEMCIFYNTLLQNTSDGSLYRTPSLKESTTTTSNLMGHSFCTNTC